MTIYVVRNCSTWDGTNYSILHVRGTLLVVHISTNFRFHLKPQQTKLCSFLIYIDLSVHILNFIKDFACGPYLHQSSVSLETTTYKIVFLSNLHQSVSSHSRFQYFNFEIRLATVFIKQLTIFFDSRLPHPT